MLFHNLLPSDKLGTLEYLTKFLLQCINSTFQLGDLGLIKSYISHDLYIYIYI